ncbi:MAG: hypothetical protein H8D47_02160 [Planctomycetes bacterium]|nr:hypothetical protein [Planctomycetota bacterium]
MKKTANISLKILAAILLTTAVMKGWQLTTKPAKVTGGYEILEPQTWIAKPLPIIEHIDIGSQLKTGTWLILFYHYDCSDCLAAIRDYQRYAADLAGNDDFLKIAFIEVPPYGESIIKNSPNYAIGKLSNIKEWFITTPAVILLESSTVRNSWEEVAPDFDAVLNNIVMSKKSNPISKDSRKKVMPL